MRFDAGVGKQPGSGLRVADGLNAETTYHFRISATNPSGTGKGADQSFTTLASSTGPHYYRNGAVLGSEPITAIFWGTLALRTVVGGSGEVICHTVAAGTVENPVGGGAGVGSTQVFAAFDCEQTGICPAATTVAVAAQALPWPSVLEAEGGVVRAKATGVKVKVDCRKEGASVGSGTFVGASAPNFKSGASALHPAFLEFDAASGTLEVEGSGGGVLGRTEGTVKILGYNAQELIDAR